MEGSRAEKGLEHFVAMAAKEGEEKGGKGEKKPCTKVSLRLLPLLLLFVDS